MHELSLCQSLLRQAREVADRHGASGIRRIHVRIGQLSGVEPDLLQQAFLLASRGTPAEGALLEMTLCAVQVHCPACDHQAEVPPNNLNCPHCGHWQTRLIGGDELLLASVDLLADPLRANA